MKKTRTLTAEHRQNLSKNHWTKRPDADEIKARRKENMTINPWHHTDETKAKLSAVQKGRKRPPASPETKAKISAALKGRIISKEHKAKLSANHWTKRPDAESIQNKRRTAFESKRHLND